MTTTLTLELQDELREDDEIARDNGETPLDTLARDKLLSIVSAAEFPHGAMVGAHSLYDGGSHLTVDHGGRRVTLRVPPGGRTVNINRVTQYDCECGVYRSRHADDALKEALTWLTSP